MASQLRDSAQRYIDDCIARGFPPRIKEFAAHLGIQPRKAVKTSLTKVRNSSLYITRVLHTTLGGVS